MKPTADYSDAALDQAKSQLRYKPNISSKSNASQRMPSILVKGKTAFGTASLHLF